MQASAGPAGPLTQTKPENEKPTNKHKRNKAASHKGKKYQNNQEGARL
jgi:hypothetical protein